MADATFAARYALTGIGVARFNTSHPNARSVATPAPNAKSAAVTTPKML